MDVRFFPDAFEQFESLLEADKILVIKGQVSFDDFSGGNTITGRDVLDIVQAREQNARALALTLDLVQWDEKRLATLQRLLDGYRGGSCPVQLHVLHQDAEVTLLPSAAWYVTPEDQLLHELKQQLGESGVRLCYHVA